MAEESPVKTILTGLRAYLHNNLRIDENFISSLSAAGLLSDSDAETLRSSINQGGHKALDGLLQHMEWYYDLKMLEKFCVFLDDYSKPAKPRLGEIAERIRQEMEKYHPPPIHQPNPQQRDYSVPGPTTIDPPSSPPATQGEPTPTVSTMDERSQKIEEIVDQYRSESTKVRLPEMPELEDDFDHVMIALYTKLSSADPQMICKLHETMRMKYRRYIHGVKPVELPSIPNTAGGLYDFIAAKSTPYEILLVHHAIDVLDAEDLKGTLRSYEFNLGNHLRRTLDSYKRRKVTLPFRKDHTHLVIVLSKEQILLSLVLHIKEYLMNYLQLEETIFEGFEEGCTVLFYSILKVDAVLVAPKILSHSAELKRMFDITHLVVFDYFACDLEKGTIELPAVLRAKQEELEGGDFLPLIQGRDKREASLKEEIATLKTTLEEKDLELKEREVKDKICQHDAQIRKQHAKLREQNAEIKQQQTLLLQKDAQLKQKDVLLKQKDNELRHKDEESGHQYAIPLHEHQQLQQELNQIQFVCVGDQLQLIKRINPMSVGPAANKLPRNWEDMKCREVLNFGHPCWSVAAKRKCIAVGLPRCIKILTKDSYSTRSLYTIGKGQLGIGLYGIAFYDQEHILVSDYDNNCIKMFTIQGQHVRTIDRGSTMFEPLGITVGSNRHIYVCDGANHCVCVFDVNGKFLFSFGSHGSGDEFFNSPRDLCFASDGYLYITDVDNSRICVYDKDGEFNRKFTTTFEPWCIDATDCGHLIINSCLSDKIMVYTVEGELIYVVDDDLGQFDGPSGVSVDSDGVIYIADCDSQCIQVF